MLTFSRTCIAPLLMIVEDEYDDILGGILNANNSDLTEFQNAGGKLIMMFSGTADPLVPFPDALNYYERVIVCARWPSLSRNFPYCVAAQSSRSLPARYIYKH